MTQSRRYSHFYMNQCFADILNVLDQSEKQTNYGSEVSRRLSKNNLGFASPHLPRLERNGMVKKVSRPTHCNRNPSKSRTYYRITPKGQKAMECWRVMGYKFSRVKNPTIE